jgi:ribosome-associated protein
MSRTVPTRQTATADQQARLGVIQAVEACEAKKAADIALLELEKDSGAFTDYFVICSGSNPRQIQAISEEVEQRLSKAGLEPTHIEGYSQAEWILLDYVDFVVHVFAENARKFYDLERLWKSAKRVSVSELSTPRKRAAATRARSGSKTTRTRSLESPARAPRKPRKSADASSAGPTGRGGTKQPRKRKSR